MNRIIPFSQSKTKLKQFRSSHPVSEELRQFLLTDIHIEFLNYLIDNYLEDYYLALKQFSNEHHVKEEKRRTLMLNLFWWRVLYDLEDHYINHVNNFMAENPHKFWKKPFVTSWFKEWEKTAPSLYDVSYIYRDNIFVVRDICTLESFNIVVYHSKATPPHKEEILLGTLLPIGDDFYFPVTDFYHFGFSESKDVAAYLNYLYHKHLKDDSKLLGFIRILSSVLNLENKTPLEQLQTSYY